MARYDKYDFTSGGFRAPLNAALATKNTPLGVSLNASGRVVLGGVAVADIVGLVIVTRNAAIGDIVDVMTHGEIVEFAGAAGSKYYAAIAGGGVSTVNTGKLLGFTVEASRLIVRIPLA